MIEILAPRSPRPKLWRRRLEALPEVAKPTTLASFVPEDQGQAAPSSPTRAPCFGPSLRRPRGARAKRRETPQALAKAAPTLRAAARNGTQDALCAVGRESHHALGARRPEARRRAPRKNLHRAA